MKDFKQALNRFGNKAMWGFLIFLIGVLFLLLLLTLPFWCIGWAACRLGCNPSSVFDCKPSHLDD